MSGHSSSCQLWRPHLPFWSRLTANHMEVGLWHNNSLLMTWYGLFRVLVQIRNNGQSTTLKQCGIMWDTWDRTASSFPAESCINITKQIRNDFFHVGRCRFAFFSPVLVISTVFPADITRVVKYGKNWLETRWLHTLPVWHTPSQQTQTAGREQRQFVWGEWWSKGPV